MSTKAVSFPFYRLASGTVQASTGWIVDPAADGASVPEVLGEGIENWDYHVNLELSRGLTIDLPAVLEDTGLADGAVVRLIVLVSTGGQRIRKTAFSLDKPCFADAGDFEAEIRFTLQGASLQGDIRIDTEICVVSGSPRNGDDPFVPLTTGSRIWSESVTAALEGSLSQFPVSSVSFRSAFGDVGDAAWMLHWSPDRVDSSASAAMRLYFNEDSDLFANLVGCDPVLSDLVEIDVLRQILVTLLADEEFETDPAAWPDHSLGNFAAQWIINIFGADPPDVLRARFRSEPGWIEARIQSFLRSSNGR